MTIVAMKLAYSGSEADDNQVDFYDVGQALMGFQRSLALTTHLILNNDIITQAPALKGASIRAAPASTGSWEIMALISLTAASKFGTLPKETPLGHLIYSAYDYVVKAILGVHVDYDKSLGRLYSELKEQRSSVPTLSADRFDALIEKCEGAITDMHRPIIGEETAEQARIVAIVGQRTIAVAQPLDKLTYEHIIHTVRSKRLVDVRGRVSSYNSYSFKGRAFLPKYGRPIPFELLEGARDKRTLQLVTDSLAANALNPTDRDVGYLKFRVYFLTSKAGTLKRLHVVNVSRE